MADDPLLTRELEIEEATEAILRAIARFSWATRREAARRAFARIEREQKRREEAAQHANAVGPSPLIAAGIALGAVGVAAGVLAAAGLAQTVAVARRSYSERLVELLREHPGSPIGDLAEKIYGDRSESGRAKVRALLAQLREYGRVERAGPGHWVVVEPGARKGPA